MSILFYDELVRAVATGTNHSPRVLAQITAGTQRVDPARFQQNNAALLDRLQQARVYVVSEEADECVGRTTDRLRDIPAFVPPTPYTWIEFAETIQAHAAAAGQASEPTGPVETDPLAIRGVFISPLAKEPGAFKVEHWSSVWARRSLEFTSPSTWRIKRECHNPPCPLPWGDDEWMQSSVAVSNQLICRCATANVLSAKYLATLMQLLSADGVEHTVIYRDSAQRSRNAGGSGRKQHGQGETPSLIPSWISVSLSQRVHEVYDADPDRDQADPSLSDRPPEPTGDSPKHVSTIPMYARLLIPGPGKPWKGETARVVWVRSHERTVAGERRARFRVMP